MERSLSKTCTACEIEKSVEEFSRQASADGGIKPVCKPCSRIKDQAYYLKNQARIAAQTNAYRRAHLKQSTEYTRAYYKRNSEAVKARQQCYREENSKELAAYRRKYYAENAALCKQRTVRAMQKRREHYGAASSASRAKRLLATGAHTGEDILRIYKNQRGLCAACRIPLNGKYHKDHFIPLARGGTNDAANIWILCPPCNLSKNARDPIKWLLSA